MLTQIARQIAFPPPPRVVRRRRFSPRIFVARFVFTPAILLLLLACIAMMGVSTLGTRYEGVITEIRTKQLSNNRAYEYALYNFTVDSQAQHDQQKVGGYGSPSFSPGQKVIVRSVEFLGYRYSTLADGWGDFMIQYGFALIYVLLSPLLGFVIILVGWVVPKIAKRLLRDGTMVHGTIEELPPGPPFRCKHSYVDEAGEKHFGFIGIPAASALSLRPGDPLTIIYDPKRPGRHVVYDFSDFEVSSGG